TMSMRSLASSRMCIAPRPQQLPLGLFPALRSQGLLFELYSLEPISVWARGTVSRGLPKGLDSGTGKSGKTVHENSATYRGGRRMLFGTPSSDSTEWAKLIASPRDPERGEPWP